MPRAVSVLSGRELEIEGAGTIRTLGLTCFDALANAPLTQLDPAGAHAVGEHLEFDYLIPQGEICLVGEITSRSTPGDMRDKFDRFRRHLDILRSAYTREGDRSLLALGIPQAALTHFRRIREFRGFVIMTQLQHFDVRIPDIPGIVLFDRGQWALISDYADAIGQFARPAFLDGFALQASPPSQLMLMGKDTAFPLIYAADRKIAKELSDRADLFTFEASPFELLHRAQVFRRDLLPDTAERSKRKFQRALITEKLTELRKLISGPDFCFPTAILLVLSPTCRYRDGQLSIPDQYGAVSVIDGQHRLFSYANEAIQDLVGDDARIMVTAVQFRGSDPLEHSRNSARIFVEINSNQTQIRPSHIDAIAYDILGLTTPRALAAQVVLRLNERENSKTFGLFDTSQTRLGVIAAPTIMSALQPLVTLDTIRLLSSSPISTVRSRKKRGYEQLLGVPSISDLNASVLLDKTVIAFDRYFKLIEREFRADWPRREIHNASSLRHAKVMGAFVKLFQHFVAQGLAWAEVESRIVTLRDNLLRVRRMTQYDAIIFDENFPALIPTANPSMNVDLKFLIANLARPTRISAVPQSSRRTR